MNRQLTQDEISQLAPPAVMTRYDKLMRFAEIVRKAHVTFFIFSNIEKKNDEIWRTTYHPCSAFHVALQDEVLRDAGLRADLPAGNISIYGAAQFFELSRTDMHAFSCDCSGQISNVQMADRIEAIANKGKGPIARIVNGITRYF
jgi:hypothetical protein